ncbi:codanin-1 like protein dlt [Lycorma delicatula]|uniref:codanin-1 like protein dlt n=1 Tax=Lycorma delicatula TaxID=130591 RepID=UPI003F519C36
MVMSDCLFDVLNDKTDFSVFIKWILGDLNEDALSGIKRSDFALYFLNYLQEQTSSLIENCPNYKKENSECRNVQDKKYNYIKQTPTKKANSGPVRKIFTSPSEKATSSSILRVLPQQNESQLHNNYLRNGISSNNSSHGPGPFVHYTCLPNTIYDPSLGRVVPYNYNCINYQHQLNPSVSSSNTILSNNRVNGNHVNFFDQNTYPASPQKFYSSGYPQNVGCSPVFKTDQDSYQRLNKNSSPQGNFKGYQTPKSNKVEKKLTPNSSSSCSSEISVMSPDSPLYSENFPAMMSSSERRNHRDSGPRSTPEHNNNQSRKHFSKRRIKPTQLNKTAETFGYQDEFGKDLKSKENLYDKIPKKLPERKQNFFDKEKLLPSNASVNVDDLCQEVDHLMIKCQKDDFTTIELQQSRNEEQLVVNTPLDECGSELDKSISEIGDKFLNSSFKQADNNGEASCNQPVNKNKCSKVKKDSSIKPDMFKVKHKNHLIRLADVYCALLDANLVPNITAEIYFVFSLLTVNIDENGPNTKRAKSASIESFTPTNSINDKTVIAESCEKNELFGSSVVDDVVSCCLSLDEQKSSLQLIEIKTVKSDDVDLFSKTKVVKADANLKLLNSVHQCVYFACAVLSKQKHFLEMLDKVTIKFLMENRRIASFIPELLQYLKNLYDRKDKELRNRREVGVTSDVIAINPVTFQMELDNRDTFSSDAGFHMFRKQRDSLYEILQIWNEKHNKPDWNFTQLSSRIEKLFLMSSDPVNMRHLARHFCDLLLKTATAMDNDTKNYPISGMPEIDKSKLSRLTERLIRPSLSGQKDVRPSSHFPDLQAFYHDFLVIPAANYSFHSHVINCLAERIHKLNETSYQLEEPDFNGQMVQEETKLAFLQCLRSLCVLAKFLGLVVFNPYRSSSELPQAVLQAEIVARNKILQPLDIQQYLVIAEDEGRLVQTVPWIVEYLGMMDSAAPHLKSYQIVLHTLFSLYLSTAPYAYSILLQNYSSSNISLINLPFHSSNTSSNGSKSDSSLTKSKTKLSWQTAVLLRLSIGWLFDTSNFPQSLFFNMASLCKKNHQPKEQTGEKWHNMTVDNSDIVDEKLLQEFCPYLVNLRILLVESSNVKQKPVRHVTPVPTHHISSSAETNATTLELQLEENFFMGQPDSLRRTVDFVAERVASACIKHICSDVIVNLKNEVLKVKIKRNKVVDLFPYIEMYHKSVEEEIKRGKNQRLNVALSALLGPDIMEPSINNICQQIAARKLQERVVNWLQSHINISELLTKLQTDVNIQNDMSNSSHSQSNNVSDDCLSPSEALILMQDLLNDVFDSRGNEGVKSSSEIVTLFSKLTGTIKLLSDNSAIIKLLLSLVLDYILLIVTYHPETVTDDVLNALCKLWKHWNYTGPLSRLLSQRNIMLLIQGGISNSKVWEKFGRVIVSVLTHDILTITNLESQAVAFFRYNWPEDVLQFMSKCLNGILEDVRKHHSCINDPKFVLMLELCSEMAADMNEGLDELDI